MMKKILAASALVANFSAFAAPDCQKTGAVCTTPNRTRNVPGLSVLRRCWGYQNTYQHRSQSMVNDCQPLQDKECSRIGSSCVKRDDSGICVTYKQKYNCPNKSEIYTEKTVCDQSVFCQNGGAGCFDISAPSGKDFGQATVVIGAARRAGVCGINSNKVEIFKGHMEECSIKVSGGTTLRNYHESADGGAAFSNYVLLGAGMKAADETGHEPIMLGSRYMCDSLYGQFDSSLVDKGLGTVNGWASDLGDDAFNPQFGLYGFTFEFTFANGFQFVGFNPYSFTPPVAIMLAQEWLSYDSTRQAMAMKCDQNLCVHIETYYSKKVLKVCVGKKRRHCCFNSRLVKIANRQDRIQLGMPMNSCGGLNQTQFQVLNSSRVDLSKFIADVVPKDVPTSTVSNRMQQIVNKKVQSYYDQ